MKQDPQLQRVEARMKPGVLTRDGFLGSDRRGLAEILLADEAEVNRLGIDHRQIADRLRRLLEQGLPGLGTEVEVDGTFLVSVDDARGRLPSPWPGEGTFPKTNIYARRIDTGEEIAYTVLQLHLIEVHGFYQGRESPFRLEPAALREFLRL